MKAWPAVPGNGDEGIFGQLFQFDAPASRQPVPFIQCDHQPDASHRYRLHVAHALRNLGEADVDAILLQGLKLL
ncbi:hypothetical protein D3C72_1752050 [compost metagenome]